MIKKYVVYMLFAVLVSSSCLSACTPDWLKCVCRALRHKGSDSAGAFGTLAGMDDLTLKSTNEEARDEREANQGACSCIKDFFAWLCSCSPRSRRRRQDHWHESEKQRRQLKRLLSCRCCCCGGDVDDEKME